MSNTKTPPASPFVWVVHPDEVGRPATTAPRPAEVGQRPAPTTGEQPRPTTSAQSVAVEPLLLDAIGCFAGVPPWVAQTIKARTHIGVERYGAPLHTHNGRDPVRDLREELLDALQYLAQAHAEERIPTDVYVPALEAILNLTIILGEP